MSTLSYLRPPLGERILLPAYASLPRAVHVFEQRVVDAVNTALAAERPLLVRGEPGTGKTQLARAVAQQLNRALLAKVIDGRSEAQELLFQLDYVARLAKAQILGASGASSASSGRDQVRESLSSQRFLVPGPLWWAFDWASALEQCQLAEDVESDPPSAPEGWTPGDGCVVLLDEIDKADSSVPNSLLEALGHGRFTAPGRKVVTITGTQPLVIVTTNEERALPDAFLRRCLVLPLSLPNDEVTLIAWLVARGRAHFPKCSDEVLGRAASLLWRDRQEIKARGLVAPGQAPTQVFHLNLAEEGSGAGASFEMIMEQLLAEKQSEREVSALASELTEHILREDRQWWLLLDNADALTFAAAKKMRQLVSRTLSLLQGQQATARFKFIAASRVELPAFKGLLPAPAFRVLSLTEFADDVVTLELQQTGETIKVAADDDFYAALGGQVHRITEGLPALLGRAIEWIAEDRFKTARDSVEALDAQLLVKIVEPYVEGSLLSTDALLPDGLAPDDPNDARRCVEAVAELVLNLSVFRILTRSHVKNARKDAAVDQACRTLTTLLLEEPYDLLARLAIVEPHRELWLTVYKPVRRLYFKHRYPTREAQLSAHEQAYKLYEHWPLELAGTDAATFFVERFYHALQATRLSARGAKSDISQDIQSLIADSLAQMQPALQRTFIDLLLADAEVEQLVKSATQQSLRSFLPHREAP